MSSVVFCFAIEGQRVIHVYTVSCMTAGLLSSTLDMHDGMAYYVVYIYKLLHSTCSRELMSTTFQFQNSVFFSLTMYC